MKNERWIVILLAALNFTHIMDFMIMMPLGEILMKAYDLRTDQFSLLVSAYSICAAISGFCASFVVDRYPRKSSLVFIYIGFIIGTAASGFSQSYYFLLITRGITGLFGGIIGSQVMAILTDLVPYERRGRAMGIMMTAFSVSSVIGVPFGLFLATEFEWNIPFFLIAGIGTMLLFATLKLLPALDDHLVNGKKPINPIKTLSDIFLHKNLRLALFQTFLITCAHFIVIPFITPYMIRNVGFHQSDIVYIYIIGGICTVFVSPYVGRLVDRFKVLPVYTILVIASVIPVWLMTHLPVVPLFAALTVTSFFFIFGGSRMMASSTLVSGTIPPDIRGSFMSINSCMQQLGTSSASLIAGMIVFANDTGPILNYGISGYVSIGISLLTFLVIPRIRLYKNPVATAVEEAGELELTTSSVLSRVKY